jgi:4-carboxymuconolactone decarboxylase
MTDTQASAPDETEIALFAKGAALRSQVLGADHVARNGGTDIDAATQLQRLMTEVGWGTFWPRGVLELKTRSLVTVAMLIALGRPHELKIHLRGSLNNGASREEVRELVIHAIPYCGFPAAIDAMRVVDVLFAELDAAQSDAAQSDAAEPDAAEPDAAQ